MRRLLSAILLFVIAAGCATPLRVPPPTSETGGEPDGVATLTLALPSATRRPPSLMPILPTPTLAPTVPPTPDPYEAYGIASLRSRSYGGGALEITETLGDNGLFMRYLVQYRSDGLVIHGFMNVPHGDGPFPVVIALHGYIDPGLYNTFDYTTRYADALANAGFLVIHPNLRGYRPSGDGDNLFRVGMAEDVLNLIALVKAGGGALGPLEKADAARIGLWGHSMGGGVSTRVITVSPDVKAAVLYGAMSGDEHKNYEAILGWTGGERGQEELGAPDEALARISPEFFFDGISAAVSIHHGRSDETVPVEWSERTCAALTALGKTVECTYYGSAPHTFSGEADAEFMQNVVDFFERYLAP